MPVLQWDRSDVMAVPLAPDNHLNLTFFVGDFQKEIGIPHFWAKNRGERAKN